MKKRIGECWKTYRLKVLPTNASTTQVSETRKAFYGGAWALFSTILTQMAPGHEPTAEDMNMLGEIENELRTFPNSLKD